MSRVQHSKPSRRLGWAAAALVLLALPQAAQAQGFFFLFGNPSPYEIERRLEAAGYVVTGPLTLRGDVYVADVVAQGGDDTHARDNHASLAGKEHFDRAIERSVESRQHFLNGLRFNAKNAARGFQAHASLQRRTRVESSFKRAKSCGSCARGKALGPSESAAAGLS